MVEMKLIKIAVLGATAAACQGKKLRGNAKKEVLSRKLGTYYWIPSDNTVSNDIEQLRTNKPTKKPTNEPTTWMGDAYPTLSPTLK